MLIGISGTLSSGKTEVARYLTFQGFKLIKFEDDKLKKVHEEVGEMPNNTNNEPVKRNNGVSDCVESDSVESDSVEKYISCLNVSGDTEFTMDIYKTFTDLTQLVDYVTLNWRENYVISHINDMEMLSVLQKRPFFLHISIDAPLKLRFSRYMLKNAQSASPLSLDEFVIKNDELLFKLENPLIEINNQAQVKIINTSTSIKNLFIKLSELNLLNSARLRPTWDSYFMRLADLAALRSNCMKRRVGCVVVRENRVIATGYNGTPKYLTNCNEGGCPRCNKGEGSGAGLSTCLCLHAEENALLEAGRDRIQGNGVLYCNTCPCLTCSIKIVQSGVKEVVYAQSYSMDTLSHKVMSEANIVLRQFQPPTDGIFI